MAKQKQTKEERIIFLLHVISLIMINIVLSAFAGMGATFLFTSLGFNAILSLFIGAIVSAYSSVLMTSYMLVSIKNKGVKNGKS